MLSISNKFLKTLLKRVTVYISSETYFADIAPANKLKNQVRRISHLSETICQINQKILKASKNDHSN